MTAVNLPAGYARIKVVDCFRDLVATPFEHGVNAVCWQRTLAGNFYEIVEHLGVGEEIVTLGDSRLHDLPVSSDGRRAIDAILEDKCQLLEFGFSPVVECVHGYARDAAAVLPTDVYSFHCDSAPIATDTFLCTYYGPASEGLRNDEARRYVDNPDTRARLLKQFGQEDDQNFAQHLKENCYDLHYAPEPRAQPFSFGVGNLWRVAVSYPGSPVPPLIHRAPATHPGEPPRLLLIS
jgi:hypothetical protein